MAEISLKDYQNKLERLLVTGTTDEVIHHCRHILQYYPKNVAAYRILGQALVNSTGIEEAGEIFRRVLGVYPDDYIAHIGLSDVYQRTGKANEAIWHMERAYEQDPNNKANNDRLRDLYRQYRQVDYPRLQLTTGAVARQYLRNGLHSQAIETLKDTLTQSPNRADLRLLMAQTLWESGDQVEAAEAALDVLKALPDCLEANRILTLLWLVEGRPSDAQRYLSRIETVDPYQAMEIATNSPVPDNAFMLPEVDYGSIAQRRLATSEPDWLSELGGKSAETTDDWMSEFSASSTETADDDSFTAAIPEDWLQGGDDEQTVKSDDMNDLFAGIQREGETSPKVTGGLTGLLAAMDNKEEVPPDLFDFDTLESELPDDDTLITKEELPDWLTQSAPPETITKSEPLDLEEPDPIAWMQDSSVEISESASPDFFADDEEMSFANQDDGDALAWLQGSGVEIIENPQVQDFFADEGEMVYQDPSSVNPLAWLEDSGVEISKSEAAIPNAVSAVEEAPASEQESAADSDPNPVDPLAWLQGSGVELVDADTDFQTVSAMLEAQPNLSADDDTLDWLKEDSMLDEMLDIENLADASDSAPQAAVSAPSIEDFFAPTDEEDDVQSGWTGQTDSLASSRSLDELAQTDDSADNVATISDGQTNMSDQNDNQLPDWLDSESPESESSGLEWLNSESPAASNEPPSFFDNDDSLDWMADLGDTAAENEPDQEMDKTPSSASDWLIETEEVTELAKAETPDWLTDLKSSDEEAPAVQNNMDWLTEEPDEPEIEPATNIPDWLTETSPESEEMQPETVSSSELEWLSTDNEPIAEPTASAEFEWLSDSGDNELEAEPAAETPDWLAQAAPAAEIPSETAASSELEWLSTDNESIAEPTASAEFEWLSDSGDDELEAETAAETPDWLAQAAPAAEMPSETAASSELEWLSTDNEPIAEPTASAEFEWLSDSGDDELEAETAAETPDWLAQAAPAAEMPSEPAASTEFDWLSGDSDEEPETAAEVDWLGEIAPTAEAEEIQAEPVVGSDFEWLSSDNNEEPEAEIAAETPDWLAQAAPAAAIPSEPAASTEFDWLSGDSNEEPETAAEVDWLGEIAPTAEVEEAQAEPVIGSDFEWLSSDSEDEELEAEPVAETPDWLAQAAPAVELEAEPVSSTEYEWLSSDSEDEEPEAEIAAETPDWLAQAAPAVELEAEPVSSTEYEWLSSDSEDEEPEAEIAAETPDWLAQAAPAVELEAEPVSSTEYEWLSSDSEDEALEAEPAAETPDWLGEIAPTAEAEEVQAEPVIGSDFEWLSSDSDEEAESEESLETADSIPEWLANAAPDTAIESIEEDSSSDWAAEPAQVDFGKTRYLAEPGESEFGWLDGEESADESAVSEGEIESAYESEPESAYAELSPYDQQAMFGSIEDDEIERAMASANAPPPAENAPDWLNAMVPGLDLDYEATEDEPLDAAYLEAKKEEQKSRDFDWLVRIVDEETGPIQPIREMVAEAAPRRHFVFKRQPAWLRTPTERQDGEQTTSRASDDDFELPDWLQ